MNVIPETEKEWIEAQMRAIEPFSFRTRLNNPIEQMRMEAIVDWGANGGANGGEGRRKEKEVKRKRWNE